MRVAQSENPCYTDRMELVQLRQLVVISEEKVLSRAAERLNLSQSALTRSIQRLEDELGLPLFSRTKNSMRLNEAGLLCVEQAKIVLLDAENLVAKVSALKNESRHLSVVSCAPAPLWKLSAEIPVAFKGVSVAGNVRGEDEIISLLLAEKADIAIVRGEIESGAILTVPFLDEQLFMQIPLSDPLAKKDAIRFSDLAGREIHEYTEIGFWHKLHRDLIPEAKYIEYTDIMVYMNAVSRSDTLTFVTALANTHHGEREGYVTVPITDGEATAHYRLAFLAKNRAKVADIVDWAVNAARGW